METRAGFRAALRVAALGLIAAILATPASGDVFLESAGSALGDWPLAAHGYDGNRYVRTTSLTPANVARLRRAWTFTFPKSEAMMEASPVVADGTMYITTGRDEVYALDAKTGALRWSYAYPLGHVIALEANRGLALLGGRVFLGTLDGHLVALDAATGRVEWNVVGVRDASNSFYSMAPLAFGSLVLIGVSNGDWGGIGYVTAFDAATGRRVWDWQTIPTPGTAGSETWARDSWKRGGGAVWGGLTFDPAARVLYFDVGNPQPDLIGTGRAGTNLYTDAMIALDLSSERPHLKWYHQFVAHDTHDWDAAMPPVHLVATVAGARREVLVAGDKGGNLWVLDARDGSVLEHSVVSTQTQPTQDPSIGGTVACPGTNGGVQYNGGAYAPETNAFFLPSTDQCQIFAADGSVRYVPGQLYLGGKTTVSGESTGWMQAIDLDTGMPRWRRKLPLPGLGGALALSSGVVFSGQLDGALEAYDARAGAVLWRGATGAPIKAAPAAYAVDGVPFVAVGSGAPGRNFEFPGVSAYDGTARVTAFTLR